MVRVGRLESKTPQVITLPRKVFDEMLAHVQAGYPNEACGVLAGAGGRVVKHYPATNSSTTPETYSEVEPRELLSISQEIDDNDWTYLAYYHSHPRTPAYPSPRDIKEAQLWPGTLYIIFSLRNQDHPEMRVFSIDSARNISEYLAQIEP
jgi:[CysO sulfur-carrier protein]-S-L-cysteine hydrolase